ncbi:MAG: DUF4091 domain-containing protein [Lentisphaeria bacterium]|nr:DUF4091 domain-containing protein [Lentisphaeria bacterium]
MVEFKTKLLSSLVKVFPKEEPSSAVKKNTTALRGEVFSFQVAYRTNAHRIPLTVEVESPLKRSITFRSVENVPVEWMPDAIDEDVVGTAPGMYPDILRELDNGKLNSVWDHWRSIWVTVRIPKSCKSGKYDIKISFRYFDKDPEVNKEFCYSETLSLEVLDAVLPPQQLKNTHWFHTDCLSNYYNVEVFSEEYWKIVGAFMKNAADHGINMILTPLFTPPLDTAPGGERKTVQLVKVKKDKKGYSFDFSLLGKWFLLAEKSGIKYFEMSHLFTQWGAAAAPKIMAEVNGKEKRIFGWDTKSDSKEYQEFLQAFLPRLTAYIRRKGYAHKVYFHCSDEPNDAHISTYGTAATLLRKYLGDFPVFDALSNAEFYKKGLVTIPVPCENHLDDFMKLSVPERWTYYCCVPRTGYSNRFIYMTSSRNRVMGLLLYKYGVEGFLQWGFNFYNSFHSLFPIDPYKSVCSDFTFPAGDGFLVYPGKGGIPEDSIRHEVFFEALQDQRSLQLLETKMGRKETEKFLVRLCGGTLGMADYPEGEEKILAVRAEINKKLKKYFSGTTVK